VTGTGGAVQSWKFENIALPQALRNKEFVYHACGGRAALEDALRGFRKVREDADFRLERLESALLLG
jgi:hypothetical protein